jgi:hypothetical protein
MPVIWQVTLCETLGCSVALRPWSHVLLLQWRIFFVMSTSKQKSNMGNSSARPSAANAEAATSSLPDPYLVLGVSRTATAAEIKKSYNTLCLSFHPDKLPADSDPQVSHVESSTN